MLFKRKLKYRKITSLLIIVALFNERKAFVIFRPKSARTIFIYKIIIDFKKLILLRHSVEKF